MISKMTSAAGAFSVAATEKDSKRLWALCKGAFITVTLYCSQIRLAHIAHSQIVVDVEWKE